MPRVALITGAARGLGLAIARGLAEDGHHCVLVDRAPHVREASDRVSSPLGCAEGWTADVSDEQQLDALVRHVQDTHGRLDVLVNNAGIHPKHPDGRYYQLDEIRIAQWNEVLAVNLTAVFGLCRRALPLMRRAGWGRIVNIASRAGRTYSASAGAHYAASKAGVIGLTRVLAGENGRHGITANCVAPGPIASPMAEASGEQRLADFAMSVPVGRIGRPDELAATVRFLASDAAGYLTGAVIDLNGGSFMA